MDDWMRSYRPADTRLDGCDDSLMGRQHCLIHHGLVLTELAIGREGAGDVTVIAVVLTPHVQQQHVAAANLSVCKSTAHVGPTPLSALIHAATTVTAEAFLSLQHLYLLPRHSICWLHGAFLNLIERLCLSGSSPNEGRLG